MSMKKQIILSACLFAAGTLSAQYQIDLKNISYPKVEYIKMGESGTVRSGDKGE